MTTKDEALDLALEALEQIASAMPFPVGRKAITAIKQARAAPVQEPVANPDECAADVYEHGTSMGLFAMTKEEAEQYCKAETNRTGYKHDWHYFGGRVHVLALIPQAQRKPLTDEQILRLVPGLQDCLCDPYDYNNSGDDYASVPKDMIRLARAIEAAHGITGD
jgi:hypothetical protein